MRVFHGVAKADSTAPRGQKMPAQGIALGSAMPMILSPVGHTRQVKQSRIRFLLSFLYY
jgi:hypothetical protein